MLRAKIVEFNSTVVIENDYGTFSAEFSKQNLHIWYWKMLIICLHEISKLFSDDGIYLLADIANCIRN